MDEERIAKKIILVMSGKGGVGKSSVSVELALALSKKGKQVGLLDIDLCGPSIPRMLGLEGHDVRQSEKGWLPVQLPSSQLRVMSMGFVSPDRTAPVIWRGPKKTAVIGQFIRDVDWGSEPLDFLVVDTPPGTSDEHITVTAELARFNPDGVVLVTTPQNVSLGDVRREVAFCRKAQLPILGVYENMSGFVCPHCSECTRIFSSGGGKSLAEACHIPYLGAIPIDPRIGELMDQGNIHLQDELFKPGSNGTVSLQPILDFVDTLI